MNMQDGIMTQLVRIDAGLPVKVSETKTGATFRLTFGALREAHPQTPNESAKQYRKRIDSLMVQYREKMSNGAGAAMDDQLRELGLTRNGLSIRRNKAGRLVACVNWLTPVDSKQAEIDRAKAQIEKAQARLAELESETIEA